MWEFSSAQNGNCRSSDAALSKTQLFDLTPHSAHRSLNIDVNSHVYLHGISTLFIKEKGCAVNERSLYRTKASQLARTSAVKGQGTDNEPLQMLQRESSGNEFQAFCRSEVRLLRLSEREREKDYSLLARTGQREEGDGLGGDGKRAVYQHMLKSTLHESSNKNVLT